MKILNKITCQNLKLNRKRSISTILGIFLSTVLLLFISLGFATFRSYLINDTIDNNGDYHIIYNNLNNETLTKLKQDKRIKNYFLNEPLSYAAIENINSYQNNILINAMDKNGLKQIKLLKGSLPNNPNEIILPLSYTSLTNNKIGETLTLKCGDMVVDNKNITFQNEYLKNYEIVGIYEDFYLNTDSSQFYFYTYANDFNNPNMYAYFSNINKAIKYNDQIISTYNLTKDNYALNNALLIYYGISESSSFNNFLIGILIIILTIVSLLCIMVIYNSFLIATNERTKEYGILRSIGASKKVIKKLTWQEIIIEASIGIISGIIFTFLTFWLLIKLINTLLVGKIELNLTIYPLFIFISLIFIIITILFSAFKPVKKALKVEPLSVIRQNDAIINKPVKHSKIISKLFGIQGLLAYKNMKRNKKKYTITIISLSISIITFITFYTYIDCGLNRLLSNIKNLNDYNITIEYNENVNKSILNEFINSSDTLKYSNVIEVTNYVENIDKKYFADTNYNLERPFLILPVYAINNQEFNKLKQENNISNNEAILVNEYLYTYFPDENNLQNYEIQTKHSFKVDKSLNLQLCDYNMTNHNCDNFYNITNINFINQGLNYLANDRSYLLINQDIYNDIKQYNSNIDKSGFLYIKANTYDNLNKIYAKYKSIDGLNYDNYIEQYNDMHNIYILISLVVYLFVGLITLIGISTIFNTIYTSMNLRRREFAILRSVGLSPKGFNKILLFESLIYGIKSILYGLPIGLILSYLVQKNLYELSKFDMIFPYKAIIISCSIIILIMILTMYYATKKLKSENIIEAIKNENK